LEIEFDLTLWKLHIFFWLIELNKISDIYRYVVVFEALWRSWLTFTATPIETTKTAKTTATTGDAKAKYH
jgi:hypothetical protein